MLALYARIIRHKIDQRYSYPLGEMIDASKALENYVKIYRKVNLKVHANVPFPAYAQEEFVLINRNKIYNIDLFTNFFTLYQLELSKKEHNLARKLYIFQNFVFLMQIFLFILGLVLQYEWSYILIVAAIAVQVFSIMFSIIGFIIYDFVLTDTLEISKDLLNLDEVEIARAESLKNDLKFHVYEYPFDFFKRVFGFLIP